MATSSGGPGAASTKKLCMGSGCGPARRRPPGAPVRYAPARRSRTAGVGACPMSLVVPPVPVKDILDRLHRVEQDLATDAAADPNARELAAALDKVRGAIVDVESFAARA